MKRKFKDRFGNEVEFDAKPKIWAWLPGESFMTSLVRSFYPRVYAEHKAQREKGAEACITTNTLTEA